MIFGTVLNFNDTKGYGFLKRHDGERDVFVHLYAFQRAGLDRLVAGQRVEFDIEADRRDATGQKMRAVNLRIAAS